MISSPLACDSRSGLLILQPLCNLCDYAPREQGT